MTGPGGWAAAVDGVGDARAGYVVTVTDRATGEVDGYGPMTERDALDEAHRITRDLREQHLAGVTVQVVRLHRPDAQRP